MSDDRHRVREYVLVFAFSWASSEQFVVGSAVQRHKPVCEPCASWRRAGVAGYAARDHHRRRPCLLFPSCQHLACEPSALQLHERWAAPLRRVRRTAFAERSSADETARNRTGRTRHAHKLSQGIERGTAANGGELQRNGRALVGSPCRRHAVCIEASGDD